MGELQDALNALDDNGPAPKSINPLDRAVEAFRATGGRVNEVVQAVQEPGMPLDRLSRWTRQAPIQALAAAFLVGMLFTRRR
jgi:hypothetical protein